MLNEFFFALVIIFVKMDLFTIHQHQFHLASYRCLFTVCVVVVVVLYHDKSVGE